MSGETPELSPEYEFELMERIHVVDAFSNALTELEVAAESFEEGENGDDDHRWSVWADIKEKVFLVLRQFVYEKDAQLRAYQRKYGLPDGER